MPKDGYMDALLELAKQNARREYKRKWRAANPDKVKAANDRYWQKKGAEYLQRLQAGERA